MTFWQAIVDGMTLQYRIYFTALRNAERDRARIVIEGMTSAALICAAFGSLPWTPIPVIYVVLMIMGSWIIPLITSYIPHDATGTTELSQTRLFRGKVLSIVALDHLYHLEHHLYPSVPHHNWARLAKSLDPFFRSKGITPIKLWF